MTSSLRRAAIALLMGLLLCAVAFARKKPPLRIFFIDVEGGQSTLVVTPEGKSVLIDTGFPGSRDAGRIQAAAKSAQLKHLDYVLITHYHPDHVGGVPDLLKRMKVGVFVDHGPNERDADYTHDAYAAYEKAISHSHRITLEPGLGLPLKGITFRVLTGAGKHIGEPLPGAGEANRYCGSDSAPPNDDSENSQSLGVLISYGKFQFLDLGDLTENKELEFLCPDNFIGTVDLYLSTHHGSAPDNPKALVWAVHPRVAIMNNGPHKGGSPEAWQVIHDSPGLAGFWQLHSTDGGKDKNVREDFIANVDDADGHFIEVTADPDGSFTVLNSRNDYSRKYGAE